MGHKRIAYALSAGALALGAGIFVPTAWAEGECVASDLEELEACLRSDATSITTTDTIVVTGEGVNKTLTINKNITGASGKDVFHIEDGASLTLRGSGMITAGRYGAIADGAELVIDGVNINATNATCYGVYAKNNGRVIMDSGQVVADYAAFAGNNTTGDMNFYIKGGLLKSNRYPAIYMPGQVDLVMRGGTLDGGIVARMGQIVIEGGTINAQATQVEGDGLDVNYNGMPSMSNEAITLVAGSYKSTTTDYGNDMNLMITGYNTKINGDIALYDLGNTAAGYEQNVNVRIEDGRLTGFRTKFTEGEIGFALKSGYVAGSNYVADRINIEITGGQYAVEPADEDIAPDSEAEYNEVTGTYEVLPKRIDYSNYFIETDQDVDGQLPAFIEFGETELIADRKAKLSATAVDTSELNLTGDGELYGAIDLTMLDRDGHVIEVSDNDLIVYIDFDEETYNELAKYDKLYAVYFNEDGEEVERFEINLECEIGDQFSWYWLWFETSHLSTYGVVGVNETEGEAAEEEVSGEVASEASTPDTGTMTMAGASASAAVLVTALVSGTLAAIVGFAYLYKKLYLDKK